LDDDDSNDDMIVTRPAKKVYHKHSNPFNNNIKTKKISVPAKKVSNVSNILNFER
jgi:hypothetical protein